MKRIGMNAQWSVLLSILTSLVWCAGCRPEAPPTGSLSGKVTLNGQPLTMGTLTFVDDRTGTGASAELDASGSYDIKTIRTGHYRVAIYSPPPKPESPSQDVGAMKLNIPDKYRSPETSGLTATVKEGKNSADFSF